MDKLPKPLTERNESLAFNKNKEKCNVGVEEKCRDK